MVPRPPSIPISNLRPATPRCGHRLGSFDAVVAGDVYASRPKIFEIMARLAQESMYSTTPAGHAGAIPNPTLSLSATRYSTTSEAMQELALAGAPRRRTTSPQPCPSPLTLSLT